MQVIGASGSCSECVMSAIIDAVNVMVRFSCQRLASAFLSCSVETLARRVSTRWPSQKWVESRIRVVVNRHSWRVGFEDFPHHPYDHALDVRIAAISKILLELLVRCILSFPLGFKPGRPANGGVELPASASGAKCFVEGHGVHKLSVFRKASARWAAEAHTGSVIQFRRCAL